jgi:hypothetical protein
VKKEKDERLEELKGRRRKIVEMFDEIREDRKTFNYQLAIYVGNATLEVKGRGVQGDKMMSSLVDNESGLCGTASSYARFQIPQRVRPRRNKRKKGLSPE